MRGIHRWPVVSPHKGPVTRKIIPFDGVIMSVGKTPRRLVNEGSFVDGTTGYFILWIAVRKHAKMYLYFLILRWCIWLKSFSVEVYGPPTHMIINVVIADGLVVLTARESTREELVSDNNLIVMTFCRCGHKFIATYPDNKVHGAKMGPIWVLPAPDGPHLAPWTLLSGYIHDAVVFSWNTFCVEFLEHSGISRRVGNDPHRNL